MNIGSVFVNEPSTQLQNLLFPLREKERIKYELEISFGLYSRHRTGYAKIGLENIDFVT